jgi:GT2 family glycosyltransferase
MTSQFPTVSVIVPTYRDWDSLRRLLGSLRSQSYPSELVEIVVVNNAPADTVPPWAIAEPLIPEFAPGSYAARNRGVSVAKGVILLFTDSDCIPNPDWIATGVACLITSGLDRVAGRVAIFWMGSTPNAIECYELALAFDQRRLARQGLSVTANLICRREVFDSVGPFNASLFSGGDWEWSRRATSLGYTIGYCHDCVVHHPARRSWAEILRKSRRVHSSSPRGRSLPLRLAGGVAQIATALMPPVKRGKQILQAEGLTSSERLKAWGVCYVLKIHGHVIKALVYFGVLRARRS